MNEALALPVVVGILPVSSGVPEIRGVVGEAAMGVGVTWSTIQLERSRFLWRRGRLPAARRFLGRAAHPRRHAADRRQRVPRRVRRWRHYGHGLAALLIFGAPVSPRYVSEIGWRGGLFVVLVLVAVRPAALAVALAGSSLSRREWAVAAWFGHGDG